MTTIQRLHTQPRMSKVVVHGVVAYLCGQTSSGSPAADITEQTQEVLRRIDDLLSQVGSHRELLLSVLIHLKSMDDFAAMNAAWESWVPAGTAPARTTVQASLAHDSLLVEMTVVAAVG
ncbi:MAG: RidA family protein [Burkholderiaceae bacterium]|nr:RidA family protein [Burkholderiaceae bacterium]